MPVEWERVLRDALNRNSKDPDETAAAGPPPADRIDVSWSTLGTDIEVPEYQKARKPVDTSPGDTGRQSAQDGGGSDAESR